MKRAYDFGGIFGEASKNHDKIPTTNLRSDEMHPYQLILKEAIQSLHFS